MLRALIVSVNVAAILATTYQSAPCTATPYACGLEYMPALSKAMDEATTDIIFQGWKFQLSTPLLGANNGLTFLGAVEKAVARGIRVYVLMWQNTISGPADNWKIMGFNLTAVATTLKRAGAYVLVDRGHPHGLWEKIEPSMRWCEHMKTVVIDQRRVFVTGIDIAEERVDSCDHKWPDDRRVKANSETGFNEFWEDSAVLAEGKVAFDVAHVSVRRWVDSCKLAPHELSDCTHAPELRAPTLLQDGTQRCGVRLSATPYWLEVPSVLHEIEDEYISTILQAKHTVFIENLYLSSALLGEDASIFGASSQNGVLRAIWSRLKRAVDEGQVDGSFSVVITLPAATEEAFTQGINIESLWQSKHGLVPTLQNYLSAKGYHGETWKKLLGVFCLAEVNTMKNGTWNFMTIYIHTKVLIVDGTVAVVGSANLNDRSLLGSGDAELDLRIDGDFALALQRRLLKSHAPSGYDEDSLAGSLWKVADKNWASLQAAWPEMFDAAHRGNHPIFTRDNVNKVTFGMFVASSPVSPEAPQLDGTILPWHKDLWGSPQKYHTWKDSVTKLPWLGPAVRTAIRWEAPVVKVGPSGPTVFV